MRQPVTLVPIAVALFAGMITLTACSKDSPTEPLEDPAAAARPDLSRLAVPTNDDFDDATVVSSLPFSDAVSTADATTADDDPDCFGNGPTVWYRYTPTANTRINVNTFGSDYDTSISAYTGSRGNLSQLGCNDDAGESVQSSLTLDLIAGETVFFMAGAFGSGPGGNLVLTIDLAPPPLELSLTIDPAGSVNASTGIATIRGTATCSRQAFVSIEGLLQDRIGRVRVEAFFTSFVECDGVTRWEAEVAAQNAYLVGGPAEVAANASAFDPATGESSFAQASATVRLRGGKRGGK